MRPWKTISEETVFSAEPFLFVTKQHVDIGNGTIIDDFYKVRLRPFVLTVPVLENGNVLVIRQYKHGPGRISLTFPAGYREDGEAPETAIERELLEETGYRGTNAVQLGEFVDNGNQGGCSGNYFIHRQCARVQAPASGDLEEMVLEEKTATELDRALFNGDIAIIHHAAAWSMARLHGL